MLGLPKATELNKPLPKKAIYAKFQLNNTQKEQFDGDISRIVIAGEISPETTSIAKGESVAAIFVLTVILKHPDYNPKNIVMLSKLIDQNMVLVLEHEGKRQLAIYHTKLLATAWTPEESCSLTLQGLNLDQVWENIITQIGGIRIEEGHTLDEQIESDERREKLLKEIAKLERQAKAEKQPKKKFDLVQTIRKLKEQL